MTPGTILWLTLNIYHEGRGEPEHTRQAIAHVTLNRSRSEGTTVREVVKAPHQFSWTLAPAKRKASPWITDPEGFLRCSLSAVKALAGEDITGGAQYFHEAKMKKKPHWAKRMSRVGRFGGLVFYKKKV